MRAVNESGNITTKYGGSVKLILLYPEKGWQVPTFGLTLTQVGGHDVNDLCIAPVRKR